MQVKKLAVQKLPSESAAGGQPWDAWQLLRFGDDLLSWMRRTAGSTPGQHLRFEYRPAGRVVCCSVVEGGSLPGRLKAIVGGGAAAGAGGDGDRGNEQAKRIRLSQE